MRNLSIKYSLIPIFAAMYAVKVTSPAQLPLVSGCRNSREMALPSDFWNILDSVYKLHKQTNKQTKLRIPFFWMISVIFFSLKFLVLSCWTYIWGLTSYSVHMTANLIWLWKATKKPLNFQHAKILHSFWLIETKILQEVQSESSNIMHHTLHIACKFCKFYSIEVLFKNH